MPRRSARLRDRCNGRGAAGLACYEVWGGSDGEPVAWQSSRLTEISQLQLTRKRFAPRLEHQRSDGAIARVFCDV